MTESTSLSAFLVSLTVAACAHAPTTESLPAPVAADQVLATIAAQRPERFKMVHQVAAHFDGQTHVLVGYLLGRRDGSFRVSASAAMGPRIFDVVKLDGHVDARIQLPQLAGRLDPKYIARAIELAYFVDCPPGSELVRTEEIVIMDAPTTEARQRIDHFQCPVTAQDDDVDGLEMVVENAALGPHDKIFSHHGQRQVTVRYSDVRRFGDRWMPARVHVEHATGPSLDIALIEYHAPADFGDDAFILPKDNNGGGSP